VELTGCVLGLSVLDRMRCEVVVLEQVSLPSSPFYTSLTHTSSFFSP
jgi:hypothetical protein